ncbi:hypothetical protein BD413DRAFT_569457 [Trametes elegans]|nr:hypothetical protein BD413DRAFT_569457 [Trametes elegans]
MARSECEDATGGRALTGAVADKREGGGRRFGREWLLRGLGRRRRFGRLLLSTGLCSCLYLCWCLRRLLVPIRSVFSSSSSGGGGGGGSSSSRVREGLERAREAGLPPAREAHSDRRAGAVVHARLHERVARGERLVERERVPVRERTEHSRELPLAAPQHLLVL